MSRSSQGIQSPLIQLRAFYTKYLTALEDAEELLSFSISETKIQELDLLSE